MSHQLSEANGEHAFVSAHQDPWHRLGTTVDHDLDANEALKLAHLANWNVRKVPTYADVRQDPAYQAAVEAAREAGEPVPPGAILVEDRYSVVFDNPITGRIQTLSANVGTKYDHAQNEALAQFGEALVDELGQRNWQTAGSLRNFSQVFLTMKLPNTMVLEDSRGKDVTEFYLALLNSHDGSTALTGLVTPVRIVCANTEAAAIRSAVSSFKIRHTSGWRNQLEEARRTLGLSFKYYEAFEAEARQLFETEYSTEDAKAFTEKLVGLDKVHEDGKSKTQRQNEANAILKLFVESPTIVGTPAAGTAWGAYNAVTEYADHYQNTRVGSENTAVATQLRAARTIRTAMLSTGLKADAWKILTTN